MTAASSKTFCILPWIHFYSNPDGTVLPCCIGDHTKPLGNVRTHTISEIWNNDKYKIMRTKMLNNERCEECSACYNTEAYGIESFRQSVNRKYGEFNSLAYMTGLDGSVETVDIKYLDIRWSNICNFKCRSCSSTYSSSWATEDNKHGSNKPVFIFSGGENNDVLFDQIKPYLTDIREIYFAGGEPLLTDKHYEVLEYLIEIGNTDVSIRYNTNLSNLSYKNKSIVEYWKHFKNVHVYVSLDSWGERAEYIREGTNWDEIQQNIKTIKLNSSHVKLSVSTVISAFNVSTLIPFLDHVLDIMGNDTEFSFYNLINPHYYSLSILNNEIKSEIIKKLSNTKYNDHIDKQLSNVITNLHITVYNEELKNEFLTVTEKFDKIRNRNLLTTFPELDLISI